MTHENAKQVADEALSKVAAALEHGHSEALRTYLAVMGRFHQYSWGNCLLIASQRPTATRVVRLQTGASEAAALSHVGQRPESKIITEFPDRFLRQSRRRPDLREHNLVEEM